MDHEIAINSFSYIDRLDNLDKMSEFTETYKLPRLNHKEIEILNK